ncbi:hypothetical protein LOD99_14797 [Oopsacas minuta]|uniref:Uncharacterized protein n=1 Tax=Oopsacas minuta TaxID=111878 RepID=A0AAV7KCE2_9METZ|nr:hypothetical protein LOD99_14797 [Oopsacas minuta]
MSPYFLCKKLEYLNTYSRRKRIGSLVVTLIFSLLLFLLFLYDLCIILATGNPDYSTHVATDYIPLFQMLSCYTLLYSLISSWSISNRLMLTLSLIAGGLVALTLMARISLNLAFISFYSEKYVDTP